MHHLAYRSAIRRTFAFLTLLAVGTRLAGAAVGAAPLPAPGGSPGPAAKPTFPPTPLPGTGSRLFPETGMTVRGLFLSYWTDHGGLAQQGYPISPEFTEISDLNGQPYTVQYFERAVFEYHPENQPPYDVLLSQLGTLQYNKKYPHGAPGQRVNQGGGNFHYFAQTGHTVGGKFWDYWQLHGGLVQQGYPVSDEFTEVSDLNGQSYTVQYFQRSVFEYHPENQPPFDVLLSQLGTFQYRTKYLSPSNPTPPPGTTAVPTSPPPPTAVPTHASTATPVPQTYTVQFNPDNRVALNPKDLIINSGDIVGFNNDSTIDVRFQSDAGAPAVFQVDVHHGFTQQVRLTARGLYSYAVIYRTSIVARGTITVR